jgi:hypothetical protein
MFVAATGSRACTGPPPSSKPDGGGVRPQPNPTTEDPRRAGAAVLRSAPVVVTNTLFYGDNLEILRKHVGDETVDLIYFDPPFNSNRSYNVWESSLYDSGNA